MMKHIRVPLSVKVRLVPSVNHPDDIEWDIPTESLKLYQKLVDAGIHLLTIHGRTRYQKGLQTGRSDWETIRKAVDLFGDKIPIFANGSIESYEDVEECLQITNADGVMSSESVLEFPPIFYKIPQTPSSQSSQSARRTISRMQIAQEYLDLCQRFPPNVGGQGSGMKCIRTHIHKILNHDLNRDLDVRRNLVNAETYDELQLQVDRLDQDYYSKPDYDVGTEELSWYHRHRYNEERHKKKALERGESEEEKKDPDAELAAECACSFFGDDADASDY
jgi:tRNA-dihydrouridine synthase 1